MAVSARPRRIRDVRTRTKKRLLSTAQKSGVIAASLMVVFGTVFTGGAIATGENLPEPTSAVSETVVEETAEATPTTEKTTEEATQEKTEQASNPAKKPEKPAAPKPSTQPSERPSAPASPSAPADQRGPLSDSGVGIKAFPTPAPLPNPNLPQKCGLNIALVFDLSNSLTDADITSSKNAGVSLVDSLQGTPTSMGIYSFASLAPAPNNTNLGLTSIATAEGSDQVRSKIQNLVRPPSNRGGTNWDRGLAQIPAGYDIVLFVTDGNPTAYGTPGTPGNSDWGSSFDQIDIDTATASSNALKRGGAFVMGIGVGRLTEANLRYISGDNVNQDYYLIGNYDLLEAKLREIGLKNCEGTITVNKQVRDLNGDLSAGAGWDFSTDTTNVTPASGTTNADGVVNFKVEGIDWDQSRAVTIAESLQEGYALEQQDGKNAVCVDRASQEPVTATNAGDLGFKVDVTSTQVVVCTVINKMVPKPLKLTKTAKTAYKSSYAWGITKDVDKTNFVINEGDENPTANYTVEVTEGARTNSDYAVTGKITVTNPNPIAINDVDVTDELDGATCSVTDGTNVTVPANGTKELNYSCTFEGTPENETGTNTATAAWNGKSVTAEADYDFADADVSHVNKTVTLADTYADAPLNGETITWSKQGEKHTYTYSRVLEGTAGECTTFDNTATIKETKQSDDASTQVCINKPPVAAKTAAGSFDRDYDWKLTKKVAKSDYKVTPDTSVNPDYTVTAEIEKVTDTNVVVDGTITVTNPNNFGETQTATVTDQLYAGDDALTGATCTVEGDASHTVEVAAGASVELNYSCELDAVPTKAVTNHATVTWENGQEAVAKAGVEFNGTFTDDEVTVTDDKTVEGESNVLGTVTVDNATGEIDGENSFSYSDVELDAPDAGTCADFTNKAVVTESTNMDDNNSDTAKVKICTGTDLQISKVTFYKFDRTYDWSIAKTGSADQHVFGSSEDVDYSVDYTVTVKAEGYEDHDAKFGGDITVTNPSTWNAVTAAEITDVPSFDGVSCTVINGKDIKLAPGQSETVSYECDGMTDQHGQTPEPGTNTAKVTWDKEAAYSANDSASHTIEVDPTLDADAHETVQVEDLKAPEGTEFEELHFWDVYNANDDHTKEYTYTVTGTVPAGECVELDNTATLIGIPERSADYNTKVCAGADLVIEKTADYTYDRTYNWAIEKTGESDQVVTSTDGKPVDFTLDYWVAVTAVDYTDTNHRVTGTITVTNPVQWSDVEVDVTDQLEGFNCSVSDDGTATIEAGGSAEFTYSCTGSPEELETVTNTATVTWDKESIYSEHDSATTEVDAEPTADVVVDEKVTVTDDKAPEGTFDEELNWHDVHAKDNHTEMFTYTYAGSVKPGETVTVENIAVLSDTPKSSDDWTVKVTGEEPGEEPPVTPEPTEPAPTEPAPSEPTPTEPKPSQPLPVTGAQAAGLAIGGALLLAAGIGFYLWSRRRAQEG
ncbi:vWA domain-containing protein [Micrococcoides hystricis]|uniref:VWA domain-containing protein n=1 Tax=Micrococcoides hystricis TaxID=1572761 RepID=A0ABV6PCU0_9MICC